MKVLGGILVAGGILMAGLSGLCSISMLIDLTHDTSNEAQGWMIGVAIFGGIPFLMGLALMFGGWKMLQEKPRG